MTTEHTTTTTSIFYVDDDQEDLAFFREASELVGESVSLFELPDDMIHAIKNPPPFPSLVFLDLNMPLKSGYDVLEELRSSSAFSRLPIIIFSTALDRTTVAKCRELGATLYLTKPRTLPDLIQLMKDLTCIDWETFQADDDNFFFNRPIK